MTHINSDLSRCFATFIAPLLLTGTGGDLAAAGSIAAEALAEYTKPDEVLPATQALVLTVAMVDTMRLSMQADLSLSMKLRLRTNANTLVRFAQAGAAAIPVRRGQRPGVATRMEAVYAAQDAAAQTAATGPHYAQAEAAGAGPSRAEGQHGSTRPGELRPDHTGPTATVTDAGDTGFEAEPYDLAAHADPDPAAPSADPDPAAPSADTDPTAPSADTDPTAPSADPDPTAPSADTDPAAPTSSTEPPRPQPATQPAPPGGQPRPASPTQASKPAAAPPATAPQGPPMTIGEAWAVAMSEEASALEQRAPNMTLRDQEEAERWARLLRIVAEEKRNPTGPGKTTPPGGPIPSATPSRPAG